MAMACALACGCVATKYRAATQDTPPAVELALGAQPYPLEVILHHVIIYNGPGSWKREALWDEYVLSLGNRGQTPLTILEVSLAGPDGARLLPGDDPWKLESMSQTLEQRYLRNGVAFARSEIPDAIALGSSAVGPGSLLAGASATVAAASFFGLPVYYVTMFGVDRSNRHYMERQFSLRRLALPRTLAPGEEQAGSVFFPMTPRPQALEVQWSDGLGQGDAVLSLATLRTLHDRSNPGAIAGAAP